MGSGRRSRRSRQNRLLISDLSARGGSTTRPAASTAVDCHPQSEWFDPVSLNATVDRLLHHAHIVLTAGDSIRLTQATGGQGVMPLTN